MKRLTHCPLCNEELDPIDNSIENNSVKASEASSRQQKCRGKEDHTYIQVYYPYDQKITQILLRVGSGETRYYMNTYVYANLTKIWVGRNNTRESGTTIEQSIMPNFSRGIDGLVSQIKVYLTFS